MKSPLVSITIPTYNHAHFLRQALQSALEQTYPALEIVVLDDGSTDETPSVVQEFARRFPQVRGFRQENRGVSTARNEAIQRSSGAYICMLESDDIMEKEKVAKQMEIFLANPEVDVVYTAVSIIDNGGAFIGEMHSEDVPRENFLPLLFFRNPLFTPSCMMAKRECHLAFPYNTSFRQVDDFELTVRLAHHFYFKYLDLPLTRYRRHAKNISNDLKLHREMELAILRAYSPEHMVETVDRSRFSPSEKTLLKGKILFNVEYFDNAIPYFIQDGSAIAHFYLGNIYFYKQEYPLALSHFQISLEKDPTNPACWNNLGALYGMEKDNDRAQQLFEQAHTLRKGYLDPKDNLKLLQEGGPFKMTFRELRPQLMPYRG